VPLSCTKIMRLLIYYDNFMNVYSLWPISYCAEVKNAWRYASIPQYIFMVWWLVQHRDNFTLPLRHHVTIAWCIQRLPNRETTEQTDSFCAVWTQCVWVTVWRLQRSRGHWTGGFSTSEDCVSMSGTSNNCKIRRKSDKVQFCPL